MPVVKQNVVLNVARNLAAFLRVEAGIVRDLKVANQRPENAVKDRELAGLRQRLEQAEAKDSGVRWGQIRERYGRVRADKLALIDLAFGKYRCRSFADLGGIGAVGGGYSFYTLDTHRPARGVLVDVKADKVHERASRQPNLDVIEGDFTEEETIRQVGNIDCVFFFAILLHQANPHWDEVLERWAGTDARVFVIHEPLWTGGEESVRLLDLGEDEYRRNAPPVNEELLKAAYERPAEIRPKNGRPYRDLRAFWQWGITTGDLIEKMNSLGFELRFMDSRGAFKPLPNIDNRAFVFVRN